MTQYTIKRSYCTHEEGSKFYQTFTIADERGVGVSISHHGKFHPGKGKSPKDGGSIHYNDFGALVEKESNRIRGSKMKRGYVNWEHHISDCDEAAFTSAIDSFFLPTDARKIIEYFRSLPRTDSDEPPEPFTVKCPIKEEIKTDPNWGSW